MNNIIYICFFVIFMITIISFIITPLDSTLIEIEPSSNTNFINNNEDVDSRIRNLTKKIDNLDKRTNINPLSNYTIEGRNFDNRQYRLKDSYGLFRQCPRHWDYVGDAFIPYYSKELYKLPFDKWKKYNNEWTWSRPRLCKSKSDYSTFDNLNVLSKRCDNIKNDKGHVMLLYANDKLDKSPFRINRITNNNKNNGWINTYPRLCYIKNTDKDLLLDSAYVLADICPNVNKDVGSVGILLNNNNNYPFKKGTLYNKELRWYFPRLCKAVKS